MEVDNDYIAEKGMNVFIGYREGRNCALSTWKSGIPKDCAGDKCSNGDNEYTVLLGRACTWR